MEASLVFSRTRLGQRVLISRDVALEKKLRLALILVDGHSDVTRLQHKAVHITDLEQTLEQLALRGFIQANNQAWHPGGESVTDTPRSAIAFIKDKLINECILVLGKDAGKVVRILEDTPEDMQSLGAAITRCKKLVSLTIGEQQARELSGKCEQLLSGYINRLPAINSEH